MSERVRKWDGLRKKVVIHGKEVLVDTAFLIHCAECKEYKQTYFPASNWGYTHGNLKFCGYSCMRAWERKRGWHVGDGEEQPRKDAWQRQIEANRRYHDAHKEEERRKRLARQEAKRSGIPMAKTCNNCGAELSSDEREWVKYRSWTCCSQECADALEAKRAEKYRQSRYHNSGKKKEEAQEVEAMVIDQKELIANMQMTLEDAKKQYVSEIEEKNAMIANLNGRIADAQEENQRLQEELAEAKADSAALGDALEMERANREKDRHLLCTQLTEAEQKLKDMHDRHSVEVFNASADAMFAKADADKLQKDLTEVREKLAQAEKDRDYYKKEEKTTSELALQLDEKLMSEEKETYKLKNRNAKLLKMVGELAEMLG